MAYEISAITDPVVPARNRSGLTEALKSIPVGKAILIAGINRTGASARAGQVARKFSPPWKFSTAIAPDGRIQIARVA